jgi:hypothetical protein
MTRELIGRVGVDSGGLMITDPSYVDCFDRNNPQEPRAGLLEYGSNGYETAMTSEKRCGSMAFRLGHEGAGVVFASGYGDGFYPVYATRDKAGRIVRVTIEMGLNAHWGSKHANY